MLNIDCIFNCLLDSFVCGTSGGQGGGEFKGVGRKGGLGAWKAKSNIFKYYYLGTVLAVGRWADNNNMILSNKSFQGQNLIFYRSTLYSEYRPKKSVVSYKLLPMITVFTLHLLITIVPTQFRLYVSTRLTRLGCGKHVCTFVFLLGF